MARARAGETPGQLSLDDCAETLEASPKPVAAEPHQRRRVQLPGAIFRPRSFSKRRERFSRGRTFASSASNAAPSTRSSAPFRSLRCRATRAR